MAGGSTTLKLVHPSIGWWHSKFSYISWLFFKQQEAKALPHRLIKKRFYKNLKAQHKSLLSRHDTIPNFFAPANTHKRASLLILSRITKDGELLLRNTLAFLSFQISHTVSKVRVVNALRWGLTSEARRDHHSLTLRPAHCLG
jgi:hypothetical protein